MGLLPAAPLSLADERGLPRFGTYRGRVRTASFPELAAPFARSGLARAAAQKRWHYAAVFSPGLVVGAAVVRLGYLASGFVYVFDRAKRALLADRSLIVPPSLAEVSESPAEVRASLRGLRSRLSIDATGRGGRLFADLPGLRVEVWLTTAQAPEPLTAICPVGDRGATLTQKTACVPAKGEVWVGATSHRLGEAFGCLDYSSGFLARETRWRWASACGRLGDGRMLGLNLVEGHNDGETTENGVWLDGRLLAAGHARFDFDRANPLSPWKVRTEDGGVDLEFRPEGLRREDLDAKVVVSRYAQPIGTFWGSVRAEDGSAVPVEGLPGVTEDHEAVW